MYASCRSKQPSATLPKASRMSWADISLRLGEVIDGFSSPAETLAAAAALSHTSKTLMIDALKLLRLSPPSPPDSLELSR